MTSLKKIEITFHWNDRFYESTECLECGKMEMEKSIPLLQVAVANHTC